MLLLYCCMVVSGLFTLVFGGDIVFFIYLTSSQSVCPLFLQIADIDVFFLCFIGYWCIFLR